MRLVGLSGGALSGLGAGLLIGAAVGGLAPIVIGMVLGAAVGAVAGELIMCRMSPEDYDVPGLGSRANVGLHVPDVDAYK
jgi:hypothetical protein